MTPTTLKALKACIEKYETAAVEPTVKLKKRLFVSRECALCKLYIGRPCKNACPVKKAGHEGCEGTPWQEDVAGSTCLYREDDLASLAFMLSLEEDPRRRTDIVKAIRRRCQAEADFLRSLLPQDDT